MISEPSSGVRWHRCSHAWEEIVGKQDEMTRHRQMFPSLVSDGDTGHGNGGRAGVRLQFVDLEGPVEAWVSI